MRLPFKTAWGEYSNTNKTYYLGTVSPMSPKEPATGSFPYLVTSGLSPREREKLEQRLKQKTNEMIEKFAGLIHKTKCHLEEKGMTGKDLHVAFRNAPFKKKLFRKIKNANDLNKFLLILSDFWSFFDYEPLAFIINNCCKPLIPDFEEYRKQFTSYCQQRLSEIPEGSFDIKGHKLRGKENNYLYLKCDEKFDYQHSKLSDVKTLEFRISELLAVDIVLIKISKGCLELVFMNLSNNLPSQIDDELAEEIKKLGIVRMRSDFCTYFGYTERRYACLYFFNCTCILL